MELNTDAVKTLIDLGGSAILTVMLWVIWKRLNEVTDRLIDIADEVRLNRVESITSRGAESKSNVNP